MLLFFLLKTSAEWGGNSTAVWHCSSGKSFIPGASLENRNLISDFHRWKCIVLRGLDILNLLVPF